jgi:HEAT repeat protein
MRLRPAVVACVLVIFSATFGAAADHDEKPLKFWVEKLAANDTALLKPAASALQDRGSAAFEALGDFNPDKLATVEQFRKEVRPLASTLIKLLDSPHVECRTGASLALALVGPEAKVPRLRLLQLLRSQDHSNESLMAATAALLFVSPLDQPVLPDLWQVMIAKSGTGTANQKNTEKEDLLEARQMSTAAETFANSLTKMLADSGRTTVEIPALISSTHSKFPRLVRATSIAVLLRLDLDARSALPTLRKLLSDDDRLIRHCAAQAVITIEGDGTSLPALVQAMHLEGKDQDEFKKSVEEFLEKRVSDLVEMRKHRAEVIPEMLRILECGGPYYQRDAIRTLRDLELDAAGAKKVVPALLKALQASEPETRETAREALQRLDPSSLRLSQVPRQKS